MKQCNLIKKAMIGMLLGLILFGIGFRQDQSSFVDSNAILYNETQFVEFELLVMVTDYEHAVSLAALYEIELLEVSTYGVATFIARNKEQYFNLLETNANLFQQNTLYEQGKRPFPVSDVDPYLSAQYAIPMMQVDTAWSLSTGIINVIVAVIDTGIDINHTEFIGRISPFSYNSVTKEIGLTHVIDTEGHGTAVAGVIAAERNNKFGIAGVAPNIQLLIIKANKDNATTYTDSAIIEAIYYAVEQGAHIINFSLGGGYKNPLMETAINYAAEKGVIMVAAAGNDSSDKLVYPAAFQHVISVSSVTSNQTISSFSNYGETIDIAAPGSQIYTTGIGNSIISVSGTSFAAPQISGILALILSYNLNINHQDAIHQLLYNAIDKGEPGKDEYYGYGIANAYYSLTTPIYTVIFLDANDEPLLTQFVKHGNAAILPPPPTMASNEVYDFIFQGWDNETSIITSDLVVRPVFEFVYRLYTYTFYDDDGITILKQSLVQYGTLIEAPNTPTKEPTDSTTFE
jgi:subtilisin family serine protease